MLIHQLFRWRCVAFSNDFQKALSIYYPNHFLPSLGFKLPNDADPSKYFSASFSSPYRKSSKCFSCQNSQNRSRFTFSSEIESRVCMSLVCWVDLVSVACGCIGIFGFSSIPNAACCGKSFSFPSRFSFSHHPLSGLKTSHPLVNTIGG